MNFKEYLEYLKDNPEGLWFKARWFGWGWVPVKWQGWTVVVGFIGIIILNGVYLATKTSPSGDAAPVDIAVFLAVIVIAVSILFGICYKKGEKPHWSWGDPRQK